MTNKERTPQDESNLVGNINTLMLGKLRANGAKGRWVGVPLSDLLVGLEMELGELDDAINRTDRNAADIALECADVANFAAMIAWNVTHREGQ